MKHSDSATAKRQEVGRGLRLAVNKSGIRMDAETIGEDLVHEINKLTVIASESYSSFVSDLQKETKKCYMTDQLKLQQSISKVRF